MWFVLLTGKVLLPQILSAAPSCFMLFTLTFVGASLRSIVSMTSGADKGVTAISLVPPLLKKLLLVYWYCSDMI